MRAVHARSPWGTPKGNGVRTFDSGATRDVEHGKLDFEGALSPQVLWAFAEYMRNHSVQADGTWRPADNWQHGWSRDVSLKSLLRHVMDLWLLHRGGVAIRPEDGHEVTMDEALGGVFFNTQALWLQWIREQEEKMCADSEHASATGGDAAPSGATTDGGTTR